MKRAMAFLCLLVLICLAGFANASDNLIVNASFEQVDSSGQPDGWYSKAYRSQAGYSRLSVSSERAHSGTNSICIDNANSNDARFVYTAEVEPESMYRLSGYVLVESMQDIGNGANFGIEDIYAFSDCIFDTNGEWKYLEWYGETGENQTSLSFGVRVGGYSAESIGKAYFDDISLEKVDELPQYVIADIWYAANDYSQQAADTTTTETARKSTGWFVILSGLFVALFVLLRSFFAVHDTACRNWTVLVLIALAALIVRIVLAVTIPGYQVDIGCFTAWSLRMASNGPAQFYAPDYFCDYPPGAMLLLWPIGLLLRDAGSQTQLLIVKLLSIVFDLLGACVLFRFVRKKTGERCAAALFALYLFTPAALVNGAAWGQIDSVLSFFMMVTAILAMEKKWHLAIPMFVVSALVKPQALLFAPVGGMMLLFVLFRNQSIKTEGKKALCGLWFAIAAAVAIVLPFVIRQENPVGWLVGLYTETLSSYAYATLNTANLYYLIGANWRGLDQLVPVWLSLISAAALLTCGGYLLFSKKQTCSSRKVHRLGFLLSVAGCVHAVLTVVGETYALYGYIMMATVYLFVILCMAEDWRSSMLPFYMALALIGVYVLGVKVHERYLFPALILLLMSYATTKDRRVLWLFACFSVTTFINTAIVLDNSVLFGAAQGHLNADTNAINYTLCIVNFALCIYGFVLGLKGLSENPFTVSPAKERKQKTIPQSYRAMLMDPVDVRMHLTVRDYVIMVAVTLGYAVLAFSNLGSTTAPQTAWVSTSSDEQVVLDLGEEQEFSVLYYAGVSYYPFSVSVSSDGVNWGEDHSCQMREGLCWQWHYAVKTYQDANGIMQYTGNSANNVQWFNGRYLRVNACESGLNLWEIVARSRNGENIPLTLVSHTGAKPELLDEPKSAANLVDENITCTGEPGWFNSMYFDEIYHAREAYHNLNGEVTYEWTHPPLGKLLMAVGVSIFGMTPFGWRFAGTLIGVLMLPALYLLALQLTKKRCAAVLSMCAFALDLMHYTQTRIATIDSFPLLFILLSYLCMVRYMQTDLFAVSAGEKIRCFTKAYWGSLLPLALSGLFMGLSIASKWTGAYSAVGLAVLFFASIWRQYRASTFSYELEISGETLENSQLVRIRNAQRCTIHRILITCGFCVLFFVVVPVVIYVVSYIPQLTPGGRFTLERVIRTQENMLSYHATPGLGMDHPFQSPWWQWPFILKPIWYVQDHYEPLGYASTIMCIGNPWVFYIGAFAMVAVLLKWVMKYVRLSGSGIALKQGDGNLTLFVLAVGFFAQYLPWMLVPRSMYIYHYFASVPFIILATAWLISCIPDKRARTIASAVYLMGSAVFFVMFFPYASGMLTSTGWLDSMKWFSRLYY